eukprot:gene5337-5574_t
MQLTADDSKVVTIAAAETVAVADQKALAKDAADSPAALMKGSQESPPSSGQNRVITLLAKNIHYFTFLPLITIGILQDINIVLAAGINVAIVCLLLLTGFFLKRGGYIKVYPKKFDLFNLCLYGALIPIGLLQHAWLLHWISVYTNGGNMLFMWATILLPCNNFVMDSVSDRVPNSLINHRLIRRMALAIALVWAHALTIMTIAAIIPPATHHHPTHLTLMTILCGYVFGFGPLLVAMILQHTITFLFRRKLKGEYEQQHVLHTQQQQRQHDEAASLPAGDQNV